MYRVAQLKNAKKNCCVLNDSFTPLFNTHTKYWKRFLRDGFLKIFFLKKKYIYNYDVEKLLIFPSHLTYAYAVFA